MSKHLRWFSIIAFAVHAHESRASSELCIVGCDRACVAKARNVLGGRETQTRHATESAANSAGVQRRKTLCRIFNQKNIMALAKLHDRARVKPVAIEPDHDHGTLAVSWKCPSCAFEI